MATDVNKGNTPSLAWDHLPGRRGAVLLLIVLCAGISFLGFVYDKNRDTPEEPYFTDTSDVITKSYADPYSAHINQWSVKSRTKRSTTCSGSWSLWVNNCAVCGGCGFRMRACLPDSSNREYSKCPSKMCVFGTHRRRETVISPKSRYIQRNRRCCYDHRSLTPRFLNVPRICASSRCKAWFYPNPCDIHPCYNGGTCVPVGNRMSYRCECPSTHTGATCIEVANPCQPNPCQNGGTCSTVMPPFSCQCPFFWIGNTCSAPLFP